MEIKIVSKNPIVMKKKIILFIYHCNQISHHGVEWYPKFKRMAFLLIIKMPTPMQAPTGRAKCQKARGPSRENSPVRKKKITERIRNNKTKEQQ